MNTENIIKRMIHTPSELHVREGLEGEQSRTITGYAILFNTESAPLYVDDEEEIREIIDPKAITQNLLDNSDIKMTMFHDGHLILARSRNGEGTLHYNIDEKGVSFEFEAPNTADGDKALELVRRGDIAGCSFAFSTRYYNRGYVERTSVRKNGKTVTTCRVKVITGIYDFTLAADPAYPDTSCEAEARDLGKAMRATRSSTFRSQVEEMRQSVKEFNSK